MRLKRKGLGAGSNELAGLVINNVECAMDKLDLESFDKSTVTSRLVRWGQWKMNSGVALGYPSESAFMRLTPKDKNQEWMGLAVDSECVQTNHAVEHLSLFPQIVIRVEYLSGYRETAVKAHVCGISKRRYHEYLQIAHVQVANNLNLLLISPHETGINLLNCLEVRTA